MKKLLPPLLFLLLSIAMPITCLQLKGVHNIGYPYNLIGLLGISGGLAMAIKAKKRFKAIGTNITTFSDPDILVTDGLYRISRNPMYLGMLIALLGQAILYQGAFISFFMVVLFFLITDCWYIDYEEVAMKRVFGEKYTEYCESVRRWL